MCDRQLCATDSSPHAAQHVARNSHIQQIQRRNCKLSSKSSEGGKGQSQQHQSKEFGFDPFNLDTDQFHANTNQNQGNGGLTQSTDWGHQGTGNADLKKPKKKSDENDG